MSDGSSNPVADAPGSPVMLGAVLLLEILVFGILGTNFLTAGNAAAVARLSVEIGLLAVALTPVIVSGGIDLSVGSMLGLAAVVFGMLGRDAGLPVWLAAAGALAVGAAGGALNGLLITAGRVPPLIVTLGSWWLFRGLALGLTGGVGNYTGFPEGFLFLGNGEVAGVPVQVPLFAVVAVAAWAFLHRTVWGRALYAIGFSAEGARHAGIPVGRRVFTVYLLSGLVAGLAAVVYVAHLNQAKADAGTDYELLAITAVVLGGTSIFGGRGGVPGTVLGLFVIAVLQNGLSLSDLPTELAGVLTGVLLLTTIGLDRLRSLGRHRALTRPGSPAVETTGFSMRNSQLAALCAVILLAAGIIAGSNWLLVKSLQPPKRLTVAMMPKSKGNAYFMACRKGAEEAASELNVNLIWDGPTNPDPAEQNRIVDTWITRGVDVIAVACENREGISGALQKARQRGIKVVTWDADAEPDARDFFVNQATPEGIGNALMDNAARVMGGEGEFAIITASLTAANMIEWQKTIEARRAAKYPKISMVALRPCDDLQGKAFEETTALLNNPKLHLKLVMAICSPAVPGAAEAVEQSRRQDVKVLGLSLPNDNKRFVKAGITDCVILWNTMDLGYLTVQTAVRLKEGPLRPGDTSITAGRLGSRQIQGDQVLLGDPFVFTKDNIDRFDF
jgi:rhamnose transport system permease protein